MSISNKLLVNVSGGEVDPLTYSRVDIPLYAKSVKLCQNFTVLPQGGFRFRNGTQYVHTTRNNSIPFLYPFSFSDQQAYIIEATEFAFRFYTQDGIVLNSLPFTIGGITNGSPTFINVNSHGLMAGGEVFLKGFAGGGWSNANTSYPVTIIDANNFSIPLDSTLFGAPTTQGTITGVYEIATPYFQADLPYLQFAQIADTAYITNNNYEPRKLVRLGNSNWTLSTFVRTNDPFPNTLGAGFAHLNAGTNANPGVFTTTAAHGLIAGQQVFISGVVGMTQLNNLQFVISDQNFDATHFSLQTLNGTLVDTTTYGAYVSGGTVQGSIWPRAVQFDGAGRLIYAATYNEPMSIWASAAPTTAATRYDDFTGGPLATDAIAFTLAPVHGHIDSIQWISSTSQFLVLGTYGSIRALYGSAPGQPITPSAITAQSVTTYGTVNSQPVANDLDLFYIERGGIRMRSIEYNYLSQAYVPTDRNLVSTHLTPHGFKQIVQQQGFPDQIWTLRYDGQFLGLTFNLAENLSGWSRHYLGGFSLNDKGNFTNFANVLSIQCLLRNQGNSLFMGGDQMWFAAERAINGIVRSIEYLTDAPVYPIRQDFNGIAGGGQLFNGIFKSEEFFDNKQWRNAMFESMKTMCNVDMTSTYDGSQVGLLANATLTPDDPPIGTINIASDNDVFTADMVGRQIWGQYDITGNGGGRCVITEWVDSKNVTVDVFDGDELFDIGGTFPPGEWYLTASTLTGLSLWEGKYLTVIADGSNLNPAGFQVVNGQLVLPQEVSYANVGYPYIGRLTTLNLDPGTQSGSAMAKARDTVKVVESFVNTLGVSHGTDPYDLEPVLLRQVDEITGRPPPLVSGQVVQPLEDDWSSDLDANEKCLTVGCDLSLPCTITGLNIYLATSDV